MVSAQYTVRVPAVLDRALGKLASARQVTTYAVLQQAVRAGLASLTAEASDTDALAEIAREVGTMSARLAHVERLAERGLYVATAAYVFARAAAGSRADEAQLTEEINAAFARQLRLAGAEAEATKNRGD